MSALKESFMSVFKVIFPHVLIAMFALQPLHATPKEKATNETSVSSKEQAQPMKSWTSVTVSVADLDEALALWSGLFGMTVIETKEGPDSDLANSWNLAAGDIHRQALLATGESRHGMIHLIEFTQPGPSIRGNAQAFDQCPKNLDIYVSDMPARMAELKAAGLQFRNEKYSEITAPDGTVFREIHLPAHDDINIVLLEIIGKELPFTEQGYAGVGPLIAIVADATAERAFYENIMGLEVLNDNILEGPEIEKMIGLPPGSALDVSIWGGADDVMGQMEVIDYRGVEGNDLYPLTQPKHRGILQLSYEVNSLSAFTALLDENDIPWTDLGQRRNLFATGQFIRLQTPAGLKIEAFQRAEDN
jgi:catechol 2,3-dioxygenase-like lactoylglutathione lyase family enzyme